jgi:hypothetical protein
MLIGIGPPQFPVTPAALMTGTHLSTSLRTSAAALSRVCSAALGSSAPSSSS